MARKPSAPRSGTTYDTIHLFCLRQYFDYIDDKDRLGGFCEEGRMLAQSKAKFRKGFKPDELLQALVGECFDNIWREGPVVRPPPEEDDKPKGKKKDEETKAVAKAKQPDLFTVAGVALPPFVTIPDANVPGGHRRVGRQYATQRHLELSLSVYELNLSAASDAYEEQVKLVAHMAAIALDKDRPLYDYRDAMPKPKEGGLVSLPSPDDE